jgi:protein gp37
VEAQGPLPLPHLQGRGAGEGAAREGGAVRDSKIEWTHHTFNPWWGCEKVSPGCANCYAEALAHRWGQHVWGDRAPRRPMSDRYWIQPHKWDVEAKVAGERRRVFCASMADVFERRPGLQPARERLWSLIEETSGLDWLLLTKRPENIRDMIPDSWQRNPRPNVWFGTSAEDQERAEARIPELLRVPGVRHFLSCEPLLGDLDLGEYLPGDRWLHSEEPMDKPLDWVIVGGESGHSVRPAHETWFFDLVGQCRAAGVPVFVKQLGRVVLTGRTADVGSVKATQAERFRDPKGGDPGEWPVELQVRELPGHQPDQEGP